MAMITETDWPSVQMGGREMLEAFDAATFANRFRYGEFGDAVAQRPGETGGQVMASNQKERSDGCNLEAMAFNLVAMASNLIAELSRFIGRSDFGNPRAGFRTLGSGDEQGLH